MEFTSNEAGPIEKVVSWEESNVERHHDPDLSYTSGLESINLEESPLTTPQKEPSKDRTNPRGFFRFRRLGAPQSVAPKESKPETPETQESRDSSNPDSSLQPEDEEEYGDTMLFRRPQNRAHVHEEEDPALSLSDAESDEENWLEAETYEEMLGSALRMAEEGLGENFFALSKGAPLRDAIDLGRRVSSLADFREVARSRSLLGAGDEERSVHSLHSQGTAETTFIKVPKVDPFSITQATWAGIVGSLANLSGDVAIVQSREDEEAVPTPREIAWSHPRSVRPPPRTTPASPTRTGTAGPPEIPASAPRSALTPRNPALAQGAAEVAPHRKWDKLRDTLQAQENGTNVGHEAQWPTNRKKKNSSQKKNQSKGFLHSFGGLRKPRKGTAEKVLSKAPGPVPTKKPSAPTPVPTTYQDVDPCFNVKIQVEDLSVSPEAKAGPSSSGDTVQSEEDDWGGSSSVGTAPQQDLEEAESLEVVYVISEDSSDMNLSDVLPPFPSKMMGTM